MQYLVSIPRRSNSVVHTLRRYERRVFDLGVGEYAEVKDLALSNCGRRFESYEVLDSPPIGIKQCQACNTDDIYVKSEKRVVTQKEFGAKGKEIMANWRKHNDQ